jgi:hypothetical protein
MPYTNGPISYHVLSSPWDKGESLSLEESDLAKEILKLAEAIQHEFYTRDGYDISAQGKPVLDQCFRALRQTVRVYYGDDHGLHYDPRPIVPGVPFPKKEVK